MCSGCWCGGNRGCVGGGFDVVVGCGCSVRSWLSGGNRGCGAVTLSGPSLVADASLRFASRCPSSVASRCFSSCCISSLSLRAMYVTQGCLCGLDRVSVRNAVELLHPR